jgi:predicted lactoylglutathione lyase
MINQVWLNLPVKDLEKSKSFFKQIGFDVSNDILNSEMVKMEVGTQKLVVMLTAEAQFKKYLGNDITNTKTSNELLISFDAESREEVNLFSEKVTNAGANVFSKPEEIQGWMYGAAFADLDGHRWNILYMDFEKMPQQ